MRALIIVAISAALLCGEMLPRFEMESLTGKSVSLPNAARGRTALLIVGFSKASQTQCRAWAERFEGDFGKDPRYATYSVAMLEAVPRLIRAMVVNGIRKSVPVDRQDRFLVGTHDTTSWKAVMGFSAADDAYLALVDPDGNVRWRAHGEVGDAAYAALREQAMKKPGSL